METACLVAAAATKPNDSTMFSGLDATERVIIMTMTLALGGRQDLALPCSSSFESPLIDLRQIVWECGADSILQCLVLGQTFSSS